MYTIDPIEVSHAYSINSTAFVVEATYHIDESYNKSYIIVKKAADDSIPTNHHDLLELVKAKPSDSEYELNPNFDPQFSLMRTKNSDYDSGQHDYETVKRTKHFDDNIPERVL